MIAKRTLNEHRRHTPHPERSRPSLQRTPQPHPAPGMIANRTFSDHHRHTPHLKRSQPPLRANTNDTPHTRSDRNGVPALTLPTVCGPSRRSARTTRAATALRCAQPTAHTRCSGAPESDRPNQSHERPQPTFPAEMSIRRHAGSGISAGKEHFPNRRRVSDPLASTMSAWILAGSAENTPSQQRYRCRSRTQRRPSPSVRTATAVQRGMFGSTPTSAVRTIRSSPS